MHATKSGSLASPGKDKPLKSHSISIEATTDAPHGNTVLRAYSNQLKTTLQAAELLLAQQRASGAALVSPRRKAISLPSSVTTSTVVSPRHFARVLEDHQPASPSTIHKGPHKPSEVVTLGSLVAHQATIDHLLGQLFRAEHELRKSVEGVEHLELNQEKDMENMNKIIRRIAELDGQFDALNTQLGASLRRKAEVQEQIQNRLEDFEELADRVVKVAAESSSKSDVIASLKCSLYLALEDCPEAMSDPAIERCFSA